MSADKMKKHNSNTIWVLTDAAPVEEGVKPLLPGAPTAGDVEKLGEQLQEFVTAFSKSLGKIQDVSLTGFNLAEVAVDVKLSATLGIVMIGQAGVTGGITLTFRRK